MPRPHPNGEKVLVINVLCGRGVPRPYQRVLPLGGAIPLAGGIQIIVTDGDYQPLRGWVVGKHTAHQTIPLRFISLMLNIRQRLRRCCIGSRNLVNLRASA